MKPTSDDKVKLLSHNAQCLLTAREYQLLDISIDLAKSVSTNIDCDMKDIIFVYKSV